MPRASRRQWRMTALDRLLAALLVEVGYAPAPR
jgi:hypothetical protein